MPTLAEIEKRTRAYSDARNRLASQMQALEEELEAIKRKRLAEIRLAVSIAKTTEDRLKTAIEAGEVLFRKPRSLVICGIRVGFQKCKGTLNINNPERAVKLIRKHFPDQEEVLVKVTETPVKKALQQLSAAELKRLGVTVTDTDDQVLIKPTDSGVDKLVNALLKEAEQMEPSEAAA